jgi:hypothetical protein
LSQPAVLGGIFIGVLSALPVVGLGNCCCCLWVVCGGVLAAYLDQDVSRPRTLARGAATGFAAGAVGAIVWVVLSAVFDAALAPLREQAMDIFRSRASDMPPEVAEWLDAVSQAERGVLGYAASFVVVFMISTLFGALGGFLGAVLFWRDGAPPALGGPTQPPPLPPQP